MAPASGNGVAKGGGVVLSYTPPREKEAKRRRNRADRNYHDESSQSRSDIETKRSATQKRMNYRPQTAGVVRGGGFGG